MIPCSQKGTVAAAAAADTKRKNNNKGGELTLLTRAALL